MVDLPKERVTPDEPPFTNVGIDFFGPFEIKRGRSIIKRYRVLFTFLNIRTVYPENGHTLNKDSCINAIRSFIARRGEVKVIRSDGWNGTHLVRVERELCDADQSLNKQIQAAAPKRALCGCLTHLQDRTMEASGRGKSVLSDKSLMRCCTNKY